MEGPRIALHEPGTVGLCSKRLDRIDAFLQGLVDEGITETIYTLEEVSRMINEGVTKEGLKAIHKVKNAFPASSIEDISKKS